MMQDGIIEIDTNDQFFLLIHLNNHMYMKEIWSEGLILGVFQYFQKYKMHHRKRRLKRSNKQK